MNIIGKTIANRYEIISQTGVGGMATVYTARDNVLNRKVAIKVLKDEFTTDDEFVKRAAKYGVSAFIVKPIDSKTLISTLKVSAIRSKEMNSLRNEIDEVNKNMESRKKLERAKGKIMKSEKLSEEEAFNYIRKISKENNISMDLIAEILLSSDTENE